MEKMMSKIIQLDEHLTNMIAAGEVVERPSGIIKELVENSIDAQSTRIDIETLNGGLDLIGVSDNGFGMDEIDLHQAFMRHSTSKINKAQDLNHIRTLGFRGEALPSISSVSKVKAISNQHEIHLDNGVASEVRATSSNQGTSIWVSELFYKVPARLKHLRSPQYEGVRNLSVIQNLALANPHIAFSLTSDNNLVFQSSGKNDLREVFYQIYGAQYANQTVLFDHKSNDFKIFGLYVLPHYHRANRNQIHLFLNHRLIRYPLITQTLLREFRRYMPIDRYPMIVLNIETDAQLVDVNVHPSKLEVRLSKEAELLMLIEKTIHESLKQQMKSKEITHSVFEKPMTVSLFDEPLFIEEEFKSPRPLETESIDVVNEVKPSSWINVIGQHHGSYILAQDEEFLYIFDQHASMERINFEKVLVKLDKDQHDQQQLLAPYVFENRLLMMDNIDESLNRLESFGLFLEPFSQKDLILRSIPLWMNDLDPLNFVNLLLDDISKDVASLNHKKLATIACHQSVRFNESLSQLQLQHIVDQLFHCEQPYHCPHGRPTFVKVSAKNLLKVFSR